MAHFDFVGKDHIKRGCRCQLEECSLDCSMRRKLVNKPTNADCIRSMSDEELAEMLYCIDHIVEDDWGDYDPHQLIMGHAFRDEEDILEWLKSPADEVSE